MACFPSAPALALALYSFAAHAGTALAFSAETPGAGIARAGGGGGLALFGGGTIEGLITEIGDTLTGSSPLSIINVLAALVIVIAGLILVISQEEDRLAKTRKVMIGTILGVIVVNIAREIRQGILQSFDAGTPGGGGDVTILKDQILGVIQFLETPAAVIAVIFIVVNGIRAILALGTEQGPSHLRRAILASGFGIFLLVVKEALSSAVVGDTHTGTTNVSAVGIVDILSNLVKAFVLLMGLAAVTVIVIAGIYMIVNVGNDEQYGKAKRLIVRVLVGLLILIVSGALIDMVLTGL